MSDNEKLAKHYIRWLLEDIELKKIQMDKLPRDSERYLQIYACRATQKKCLRAFIWNYRQQIGNESEETA